MFGPFHSQALREIEALARVYSRHVNRAESTVIRWSSGSGDTLARLREGKPITTDRVDKTIAWFADNWPAELEWPSTVQDQSVEAALSREEQPAKVQGPAAIQTKPYRSCVMSDRFPLPPRRDAEDRSSIREWIEDFVGMICFALICIGSFIMLGVL